MDNRKIMVVDDEAIILFSVEAFFDTYNITTFSNAKAALADLDKNTYDIIIVDYKMPGLDGFDLLVAAKKKNAYKHGILVTAYADKKLVDEFYKHKLINDVLEKPLALDDLQVVVDNALKKLNK
ncbi:MAG: response regulator [Spirochaetales bacterium]|nr:response regulator [Spirochaetales bacterium]